MRRGSLNRRSLLSPSISSAMPQTSSFLLLRCCVNVSTLCPVTAGCTLLILGTILKWMAGLFSRRCCAMIHIFSTESKIFKCYPVMFAAILFLVHNGGHGSKSQKVLAQSLISWQYPMPELLELIDGFSSPLLMIKAICLKLSFEKEMKSQ